MNDVVEKLQSRILAHQEFLHEYDRSIIGGKKHLDQGTPERAYWHYGYMVALRDVLKLLEK